MAKKILALSLVAVMLSVTAFASGETPVFTKAGGKITAVTEMATVGEDTILNATHSATLPEAWDGTVATEIDTDADGTYLISNGAELAYFGSVVAISTSTAKAKLDADINLGEKDFQKYVVGGKAHDNTSPTSFKGEFDGQGHTIYNLCFASAQKYSRLGLFRQVSGGTVKNLNFVGAKAVLSTTSSTASHPQSFVCGRLNNGGTLENIYIEGKITGFYGSNIYGRVHVFGAICGDSYDGTIRNCISNVDINLSGQYSPTVARNAASGMEYNSTRGIGGILGRGYHESVTTGTLVTNCGNIGNINAPFHRFVGGVVGEAPTQYHRIENCWNTGNIIGYGHVGGVIGYSKRGTTAYRAQKGNLYNTGNVIAVAAHTEDDTTNSRTDDKPYAAGLGVGLQLDENTNYASYSVGDVYTKTSTALSDLYTVDVYDANNYFRYGLSYKKIGTTKASSIQGKIFKKEADGIDDMLGENIYDENAPALTPESTALLVVSDSVNIAKTIKGGLFYIENGVQAPFYWEKTVNITEGEGEEATTTTKTVLGDVTTGATALTDAQFKSQEAVDALNAYSKADYVMDTIGINGGYPIFRSQLDNLVTDVDTYQIGAYAVDETAHNYELGVTLDKAGYVSLDVKPFGAEEVTIKAFAADGTTEIDSVTVSEAGIITLATGENANVVIKATTGRALIELDFDGVQAEDAVVTTLENGIIEATFDTDAASATVVIALYENATTLKTVVYAPATVAADGKVSATIDLTEVDVAGCTLKAFLWEDGTLEPLDTEAVL